MKILVDGRPLLRPWMGGVPRLASGLVPALAAALKPHETVIATTGARQGTPNKLVATLTFTGLSSYDRLFAKEKADVLFLPNLEFVGKPKIPYALLVHDLSFLIEPRWFGWKARLWHVFVKPRMLIKNAAHVFAVSETTKRDLVNLLGIDANVITVIPIGLEREEPLPEKKDGRYILALGGTRKNVECLEAAHAELVKHEKYKDVELVMTGTPRLRRPSYRELFSLMRDASIFCYPSWYEGFGLPLHEAARFGTPCLASTAGSLPEIAPVGTRFAPPSKPHLWVEEIRRVLDNPDQAKTETNLGDWTAAGQIIAKTLLNLGK